MQPIEASTIQNQTMATVQKHAKEEKQKDVPIGSNPQNGKSLKLPDDIVTISSSTASRYPENKRPSTPVTRAEKELLLNNSSEKAHFSVDV